MTPTLTKNSRNRQKSCHMRENVINCLYNYCPMATNMIQSLCQLPYGNERELNDGRRVKSTLEDTWLEPLHAQAAGERVFIRSEVAQEGGLYLPSVQVARSDGGRSFEETRSGYPVANTFSVTAQSTPISIGTRLSADCCKLLLRAHSTTLSYGKSREWYGVAGRDSL